MNRLDTTQYLVEEVLRHDKFVVKVNILKDPFTVKIYYSDDTNQIVTGKIAWYIINAKEIEEED